ncbi:MAG: O-antigen ligase family protein [Pyrinomonadaceae bacterium]|nr:O-antigen ligase family protein [Pyrinomonadaceae bacterium]
MFKFDGGTHILRVVHGRDAHGTSETTIDSVFLGRVDFARLPTKEQLPSQSKSIGISRNGGVASVIDVMVFYGLAGVIFLAAIPYGSVEPWWKAVFQCLIFALAGLSLFGQMLRGETRRVTNRLNRGVLLPVLALIAFAVVQTIPWSTANLPGLGRVGRTLSVDAFQTWLFAIHLTALVLLGWMLVVHTDSQRRLRLLVNLIIVIGVVSAMFGIWRQASQREVGFVLPYLRPALGYAQFINYNHFAFLMEMALGLVLGIVVCKGVAGKRLAIYLGAAVPMWVALVLANSRGGILSILCQVIFLALLLGAGSKKKGELRASENRFFRASRMVAVRGVLIVALLAGAVATLVFVGGDPLGVRLETVPLELDRQAADASTLRQSIWRATWEMIKDHPIAGVGFGGYATAIPKYHPASGETTPQEAHNDYLELLASGGLIALIICIWFVVSFLRAARSEVEPDSRWSNVRYLRAARLGALAGLLTVSIHSLVDFGLHIPINAFVFTVLLAIALVDAGGQEGQGTQSNPAT